MIVSGIDAGGKNIHGVILNDGQIITKGQTEAGINKAESAARLFGELLDQAGLKREQVERVAATGSAGKRVEFANDIIPEVAADSRGVHRLFPDARTIIDVGAEEGRAIKISADGKILDFAINDKCAAGTGTFVEAMAKALEISVEEMSRISLGSTKSVSLNAQCAVFGESEVVSLIHAKTPKHDIARAIHDALAERVGTVVRIVGPEKDIVMIGGMALNSGFVESLKREIGMEVIVPESPGYIRALGAAISASNGNVEEKTEVKVAEKEEIFSKGTSKWKGNIMPNETIRQEHWRWPEGSWVNPDLDWKKGKLITAGIDVGSVSSQAVVVVDGDLYAYSNIRTGSDSSNSARKVLVAALEGTGLAEENLDYCIGTGYGRINVPMAQQTVTEIACHARGASFMYGPEVRTVMDMGGQDCKAISIDEKGKVLDFMMNDKCAAGTGRGMEVFAELIGVPVWEIGARSFRIEKEPSMISSTCVVFAKTEVVGLLEKGVPDNEIIAAYCSAMAHRILELLDRLGVKEKFVITGGIAKNEGVVKRLEKELGINTAEKVWYNPAYRQYPFDTQIAGALGAAVYAHALLASGKVQSDRKA